MSGKRIERKKLKSSQKLFLFGVTTFGAMLLSNNSLFTTTVHASTVNNQATDQAITTTTDVTSNNTNDNTVRSSQVTNDSNNNVVYNALDTKDSASSETDNNKQVTRAASNVTPQTDTTTTVAKNVQQQPKTEPTATTTKQVNTTIGNSVTDTDTYNQAQKSATNLKNENVDLDQVYYGVAGDPVVDKQLAALGSETAAKLNDNGYLIKSGLIDNKKTMVISGKDDTGLYYAINTVANLVAKKSDLTNINISESPQMSIRGVIEGFYGEPWSQQARKDLFQFMGDHKMNVYIYSPKDDDYLRMNWRELYPKDKLEEIQDLVSAAHKNHVQFVYTLSPGNDITYSSQKDFDITVAKLNQLRSIGVDQFYIALDDIPLSMTAADSAIFKNHPTTNYPNNPWSALADAQAYYVNKVQTDYIEKNKLPDLWLVPTNYNGSARDPFKEAQGEALNKNIRLQWTGEGVFSGDITKESVEQAKQTYHTDHIFIWDNFPVNDSDQDRLYLNPLEGRSNDLYQVMDGFTSNPMIQPYASWFSLASFGKYMWNADKYNPGTTLQDTIRELAGDDPQALVALQSFVDLNQYWNYATEADKEHAPILSYYVNAFEKAEYGTSEYSKAKQNLINHLDKISNAPETLKKMKVTGFYDDSLPWINAASHWAKATISGINILDKINSGKASSTSLSTDFNDFSNQIAQANVKALPDSRTGKPDLLIVPSVGDGVFQTFQEKVTASLNNWLKATAISTKANQITSDATTDIPQNGDYSAANMNTNDLSTKFWSNRSVKKGDTIKIDLKDSQEIQRLNLHQGASDDATSGDMFNTATIYAGNNADGSDKTAIGNVTAVANYQLDLNQPIKARYLFITATSDANNWLQIRNISVFGETGLKIENIKNLDDSSAKTIFDGTVQTAYTGQLADSQRTGVIEQTFTKTAANEVYLAGKVSGTVYVHQDGKWQEIGRAESNQSITTLPIKGSEVDGLRLVIDSNTPDFVINEFGTSNK